MLFRRLRGIIQSAVARLAAFEKIGEGFNAEKEAS